ncbi:MAG TPA: HAMP domain-containing histidine kinase [Bacteroidetes bacterium]|nr:HAMP domain-containing histidine kinase [Bacteroidota bacterium]
MEKVLDLKSPDWRTKYSNPELQIQELFRNYNISTELIRKTTNLEELLDLILKEYVDRFEEIPGVDLVNVDKMGEKSPVREKLRSLIMFASHAVLLKENAEIFKELERANRKLAKKTRQLEEKNRQLKQLNHQYLNMLGFVSHELRSPLISILGFAELLDEGMLGTLNEEQRKANQVIIRSARTLIDMIKNYLDLARIEQGEIQLERKVTNLVEDVLFPILEEMREQFERRNLSVFVESSAEDTSVFCDPGLMRIVLVNLLSNAAKYAEEGGDVRITVERKGDDLVVTVFNTGPGLKKSELKKLFQKFTQLESHPRSEIRSSGLGLYNARYIVEKHGGKIWAESEPGKWFSVSFSLPLNVPAEDSGNGKSAGKGNNGK